MNLFQRAKTHIPGGVNSPVRAFQAVGGEPIFIERGEGPYIFATDGKRYIDYVASWGPLILGHAHPVVMAAVGKAVKKGLSFGTVTAGEVELAELICHLMPAIEKVRLVNSGTEATMSAIRLARGFTGRKKIIKFEGCYHGHADSLLVKAGSGALTFGKPTSSGVPDNVVADTYVATYNDPNSVKAVFDQHGADIAAVIVEPVAGNMGCVPPAPGFLTGLRQLCDDFGSLLIFDEVMTGFRVALGGAQARYNITPDLTTLGKIIGGGMPVGAFGGRADIMNQLSPDGPVYQAGTLSGNPIAVAAGLANLQLLCHQNPYPQLEKTTQTLVGGLLAAAKMADIPLQVNQVGSMFGLFFNEQPVTNFKQVMASQADRFKSFFHYMLDAGVYLAPSAFESGFVSTAHNEPIIAETLTAAQQAFTHIRERIAA